MDTYEERDRARQAVLLRATFGKDQPPSFPVALNLRRCGGVLARLRGAFRRDTPHVWASKAGDVYPTREQAAYADWMDTPEYRKYWDAHSEASRIVKAEHIQAADYGEPIFYNDRYFDSIDEFLADLEDDEEERPIWVWASEETDFHFDLQDALGNYLLDNHHEDAECDHMDELIAFYQQWAAKQTLRSFWESHKRIVVIDATAFAEVLADAKLTLDIPPTLDSPYAIKAPQGAL